MAEASIETGVNTGRDWSGLFAMLFATTAVLGMLCGALTITLDVGMRWFAGTAILALNEITAQLFAVAVAATLPAGALKRVNLKVDLLASHFGPRATKALGLAGSAILAIMFTILAWRTFGLAAKFGEEGRMTAILYWPVAPTYFFVATAFGLSAAIFLRHLIADALEPSKAEAEQTSRIGYLLLGILVSCLVAFTAWAVLDLSTLMAIAQSNPGPAALLGFGLLWLGVFLQLPLAAVSGLVGVFGTSAFLSWGASANVFANDSLEFLTNSLIATLPLFLMMGSFAVAAGVSHDIYKLANALTGRVRGGLAYATVAGCAGFGAISGNSIATAATFGRIALPEMAKRGYPASFASGTVAAGGTLGSLVPPSGALILFALLTQESIATLFVAAMVPALLAILLYFSAIFVVARRTGLQGMAADEREPLLPALVQALPVIVLFGTVVGGLSSGIFTTTESAAVGAVGAFLLALFRGKLNRREFLSVMAETTQTTALIYGLIFGAIIFSFFINIGQAPEMVANWIGTLPVQPIVILIALIVFYLVLGAIMDSFAVMVITVPVVTPLITGMGFDIVYWGVLMLVIVEMGLITPPFGINLFVIKSLQPATKLADVMRGVMPFVVADLVKVALLVAFPAIALWLPSTLA